MDNYSELLKKQIFWSRLCAIFLVVIMTVVLLAAAVITPNIIRIENMLTKLDKIADNLTVVSDGLSSADWETISTELSEVSGELSQINWTELSGNINSMAIDAQESMGAALAAIDELDIEKLNQAIADLQTVIQPLANIVGRFK